MSALPAARFDACDQATGQVSSQSLVRYKSSSVKKSIQWIDFSEERLFGVGRLWPSRGLGSRLCGPPCQQDRVVIGCGAEIIARHPRSYDRADMIFNPIHYLPLIEKKINALDQAAPLAEWDLPPEFQTLRRLMAARMLKAGRRDRAMVPPLVRGPWRGCKFCGCWRHSS